MVKRIIGGVVSIALALAVYFGWDTLREKKAEADAPQVGDCLIITGSLSNADDKDVACDDATATYEVVGDDGECDKTELSYTITLGDTSDQGNVADLCLAWNAKEGDCFRINGVTEPDEKVACTTEGDTVYKVVAAFDSASEKCPKGSKGFANKKRDRLVCFGPNA